MKSKKTIKKENEDYSLKQTRREIVVAIVVGTAIILFNEMLPGKCQGGTLYNAVEVFVCFL